MPAATTKHSRDQVLTRIINNVLKPNLNPALPNIFPYEKFDNQPRLRTTVNFIASLSAQLCAAVRDSSGLAPVLSANEILSFNPGTVDELASLVYDRLRNRDLNFITERVMNVILSVAPAATPATTFASLGWGKGVRENVVRSIRANLSRHLRFQTNATQMGNATRGQDLINMIRSDFFNQARAV